jgi:A/G-specific adenine glycosylase
MHFSLRLLSWFLRHRRILPWRDTNDPYAIWISEVLLQQTRIDQGIVYYQRFLGAFPDVSALAAAPEEKVLRLWQGLGYYSRARNLHQAARYIMAERGGCLPESHRDWLGIRGVGPYTAAAIASIAYGEAVAALDGNGYRVLSRIFAIRESIDTSAGRKAFQELAEELIDRKNPGDFNQALMDFGSLVCKPARPLCTECIFQRECLAFNHRSVDTFPVRKPKKTTRTRYFYYFLFYREEDFFIQQRKGDDIWKNLFELPLIETPEPLPGDQFLDHPMWQELFPAGSGFIFTHSPVSYRHLLTHQVIQATFFRVEINADAAGHIKKYFIQSDGKHFDSLAKPRLIEKFMAHHRRTARFLPGPGNSE